MEFMVTGIIKSQNDCWDTMNMRSRFSDFLPTPSACKGQNMQRTVTDKNEIKLHAFLIN